METLKDVKSRYITACGWETNHKHIHQIHIKWLSEFYHIIRQLPLSDEQELLNIYHHEGQWYTTLITFKALNECISGMFITANRGEGNSESRSAYVTWLYTGNIYLQNGTVRKLSLPMINCDSNSLLWITSMMLAYG